MEDFLATMAAELLVSIVRGFGFSLAVIPTLVWLHNILR